MGFLFQTICDVKAIRSWNISTSHRDWRRSFWRKARTCSFHSNSIKSIRNACQVELWIWPNNLNSGKFIDNSRDNCETPHTPWNSWTFLPTQNKFPRWISVFHPVWKLFVDSSEFVVSFLWGLARCLFSKVSFNQIKAEIKIQYLQSCIFCKIHLSSPWERQALLVLPNNFNPWILLLISRNPAERALI